MRRDAILARDAQDAQVHALYELELYDASAKKMRRDATLILS